MYAYCSNYPWLFVFKNHLTRCRNCLPFQCAFIQKQTYVLGRCCSFAFNLQCNVFICLSSIVSLCLLLTLTLYYRSSFSLVFFFNFTLFHKWENVYSALNPLKNTLVDWISHMFNVLLKMFHFVSFPLLSLC